MRAIRFPRFISRRAWSENRSASTGTPSRAASISFRKRLSSSQRARRVSSSPSHSSQRRPARASGAILLSAARKHFTASKSPFLKFSPSNLQFSPAPVATFSCAPSYSRRVRSSRWKSRGSLRCLWPSIRSRGNRASGGRTSLRARSSASPSARRSAQAWWIPRASLFVPSSKRSRSRRLAMLRMRHRGFRRRHRCQQHQAIRFRALELSFSGIMGEQLPTGGHPALMRTKIAMAKPITPMPVFSLERVRKASRLGMGQAF